MSAASGQGPTAAEVADYLAAHPQFFDEHATLLAALHLPHPTGPAVSLWERQNAALRDEAERWRARFEELIVHARQNEALIGRIQQLVLAVLTTTPATALLDLLAVRLAEEFRAERVTTLVFAGAVEGDVSAFVGRDSPRREPFFDLLSRRTTLCGRLNQAQRQALFGAERFEGSHVVLPLLGRDWDGLLVVSSADPARFEASMGTEILSFLCEVLTIVLTPRVAALNPA
jgi:uncharacterized protein YigA (DUF484 family)